MEKDDYFANMMFNGGGATNDGFFSGKPVVSYIAASDWDVDSKSDDIHKPVVSHISASDWDVDSKSEDNHSLYLESDKCYQAKVLNEEKSKVSKIMKNEFGSSSSSMKKDFKEAFEAVDTKVAVSNG
jgi:hypothetical protein